MNRHALYPLVAAVLFALSSCGPSKEAATTVETKEALYAAGHRLYQAQDFDTAAAVLKRSVELDSSFLPPLTDLAGLYFDAGMRIPGEKSPERMKDFRQSRLYFGRMEALGAEDAETYDRLCELSLALGDSRGFLLYSRKNAARFPYDRQYYNLGVALFGAGDYNEAITTLKNALAKFPQSSYAGGFYRQLGLAYMKIDRDQTAERTFTAGVTAVDASLAQLKKGKSSPDYRRLMDDKIGMLLSLKRLHQIYREADKLEEVEKELKEAGYEQ